VSSGTRVRTEALLLGAVTIVFLGDSHYPFCPDLIFRIDMRSIYGIIVVCANVKGSKMNEEDFANCVSCGIYVFIATVIIMGFLACT
jgi:hypothetical protein